MRAVSTLLICLGLSAQTIQAGFQSIGDGEGWLVGGAVEVESLPYSQADDFSVSLQPYVAYEWENLHVGVDDVSYDFYATSAATLTFAIQPRWPLADEDVSSIFSGLHRDDTIEAGLILDYVLAEDLVSQWYWESHYFQDVSRVYQGEYVITALGYEREYAQHAVDISVGLHYQSTELSHYLYGVNEHEQNPNRQAFNAEKNLSSFIDVSISYPFMNRSLLVANINFDVLDQNLKGSPLLENTVQASVLLGWVKIF